MTNILCQKLCRQKRNRSSEDSRSKGKLRTIEGQLKPAEARKGETRSVKVQVLANKRMLFVELDDPLRPPALFTMTFVDEDLRSIFKIAFRSTKNVAIVVEISV